MQPAIIYGPEANAVVSDDEDGDEEEGGCGGGGESSVKEDTVIGQGDEGKVEVHESIADSGVSVVSCK